MSKKVLLYVLFAFVLVVALSYISKWNQDSKYPKFVLETFEGLKNDPAYLDSIGRVMSFEFGYDEFRYQSGDTTSVFVNLVGRYRKLNYQGWFVEGQPDWVLVKENLIIE